MLMRRFKSMLRSEDGQTADPAEKRADQRRKVLLRATIYAVSSYADVTVRNVSRSGLMGATSAQLKVGQSIAFSIDGKHYHLGTVRWARSGSFGLHLDDAIAICGYHEEIESGYSAIHAPRERRHSVSLNGRIALGPSPFDAIVRDVSQSGLRLETDHPVASGQELLVKLRDRPLISAHVRWTMTGKVGVKTSERMPILRLVYSVD